MAEMTSSPPNRRLVGSSPTLDVPKLSLGVVLKKLKCHVPCNIEMRCAVKVRSFKEDSCAILISFKSVVIFAEIKTKSPKMKEIFERNEDCATVFFKK